MSELLFQDVPQVELLQWLARGSLNQKLLRAIRLWVWLRSLYGTEQERLVLGDSFTYAEWRDVFFSPSHTKGEEVPNLHDSNCPCAKTTQEWLFNQKTGIVAHKWQESLIAHIGINESKLNEVLKQRLFGITRRSLQGDLEALADLGWLIYKNEKYYLVSEFPPLPVISRDEVSSSDMNGYENFLPEDLAEIAQNHSREINGVQRFFLKVDYVIPRITIDSVSEWQYQLRQFWAETPVPPIQLTYASAKVGKKVHCIVYPVCIYYVQRAVYLCAFGESPDRQTQWYNFRLDRIQKMDRLRWDDPQLPSSLHQHYQSHSLPSPDYVALEMSKAWGFDFYLPSQLMLVRFDQDYSDRYVKDTQRHETFEQISYQQAQNLFKQKVKQPKQKQTLLKILANRSPEDAYYQAFIRYQDEKHRDNNVIMRLRAWRPQCEVLFPYEIRQSIAADVAKEFQLYHQD
ncbi:TIGR03985 family CRISPR-associated protein [Aetokthonos hydrillicola Thurmond2011]|uniref:TIGR03985 family CRISPR-associated protein n=1 Tax=Aetokthonos hydrillicola Thurmond2011 TaxID=2712845 RepID=A0AAP5MBG0_9CYAN|nr:TIGR03985 family CRISPR-associated protein [Aetokthonos hydrillicola]MBO3463296.1 TIGR03985 family CRISPR-associated protein [Aetokthonos hydrillicola CCALA 1050]MBW4591243.1 TIGR03985 family CRISPR-associated protein [Aetokthonos hydrillicola CCALA 1050]MDR9897078.1 TIGR03985 family CRISPR-associated protein [Aetokthonos hydrillicola Thurmond2011]